MYADLQQSLTKQSESFHLIKIHTQRSLGSILSVFLFVCVLITGCPIRVVNEYLRFKLKIIHKYHKGLRHEFKNRFEKDLIESVSHFTNCIMAGLVDTEE